MTDLSSSERLARALEAARLYDLAGRARADEFHDFKSPHAAPQTALVAELQQVNTAAARKVRHRVTAGEFDAPKAEADQWAASPDGQAAFAALKRELAR